MSSKKSAFKSISILVSAVFFWTNCVWAYSEPCRENNNSKQNISDCLSSTSQMPRFATRSVDTTAKGQQAFNLQQFDSAVVIEEVLDPVKARQAVEYAVAQNPFLATTMQEEGGEPVYMDLRKSELIFTHEEITTEEAISERVKRFEDTFIDPFSDPQIKVLLITSTGKSYLCMQCTHYAWDGNATRIFSETVREAYQILDKGEALPKAEVKEPSTSVRRVLGRDFREATDKFVEAWKAYLRGEEKPFRNIKLKDFKEIWTKGFKHKRGTKISILLMSVLEYFDFVWQLTGVFREPRFVSRVIMGQWPLWLKAFLMSLLITHLVIGIFAGIINLILKPFGKSKQSQPTTRRAVVERETAKRETFKRDMEFSEVETLKNELAEKHPGLTVTHILLALYARALEKEFGYAMPIIIPVDLRKFVVVANGWEKEVDKHKSELMGAISGPQYVYFGSMAGLTLEQSIARVHKKMTSWGRRKRAGLAIIPASIIFLGAKYEWIKKTADTGFGLDFLPVFSSMGQFDKGGALYFGKDGAHKMSGLEVYPPYGEGPFPITVAYTIDGKLKLRARTKPRVESPRKLESADCPERVLANMVEDFNKGSGNKLKASELKETTNTFFAALMLTLMIGFKMFYGVIFICVRIFRKAYEWRNRELLRTLDGKTMLVTGGTSGLGLETVKIALRQGATVVVASRSATKKSDTTQQYPDWMMALDTKKDQLPQGWQNKVKCVRYDATEEKEAELLADVRKALNGILPDFVVLNAGTDIDESKPGSIAKGIKTNKDAPIAFANLFKEAHKEDSNTKRHIIAIGSTSATLKAKVGEKPIGVEKYGETKEAVEKHLLSDEYKADNLSVTSANPGMFRTTLLADLATTLSGDFTASKYISEFESTDPKAVAMNIMIDALKGKQVSWPTWDGWFARLGEIGRQAFHLLIRLGGSSENYAAWRGEISSRQQGLADKTRTVLDVVGNALYLAFPERRCPVKATAIETKKSPVIARTILGNRRGDINLESLLIITGIITFLTSLTFHYTTPIPIFGIIIAGFTLTHIGLIIGVILVGVSVYIMFFRQEEKILIEPIARPREPELMTEVIQNINNTLNTTGRVLGCLDTAELYASDIIREETANEFFDVIDGMSNDQLLSLGYKMFHSIANFTIMTALQFHISSDPMVLALSQPFYDTATASGGKRQLNMKANALLRRIDGILGSRLRIIDNEHSKLFEIENRARHAIDRGTENRLIACLNEPVNRFSQRRTHGLGAAAVSV